MAEPVAIGEPDVQRRFQLLDVLRFTAAIMVVCFHWFFNGTNVGEKVTGVEFTPMAPIAAYGYLGVYLFFAISGFVIGHSAAGKTAGQFAVGRAVRLYPAFWVALIATTVVVTVWGNAAMQVSPAQFIANLTMLPNLLGKPPVDGVYWTLAFELAFYGLVLLLIVLGAGRHLDGIFSTWGILLAGAAVIGPAATGLPFLGGDFAFFAAGAIIAAIQRRGGSVLRYTGLAGATGASLFYVGVRAREYSEWWAFEANPGVVVAICALFLVAMTTMWLKPVANIRVHGSRLVSDLTFPVYLLHAHIGYVVLDNFGTSVSPWLLYPVMFTGLIAASWLLHRAVEVKLAPMWRRVFGILRGPLDNLQGAVENIAGSITRRRADG